MTRSVERSVRRLVGRLAGCVFPFMCAHGRPSMVPLGGLGSVVGTSIRVRVGREEEESFVGVWKKWKGEV